jgi:hypothetical protein
MLDRLNGQVQLINTVVVLLYKQIMLKVNGSPLLQTMTKRRTTWPCEQREKISSENYVLDLFPSNGLFLIVTGEVTMFQLGYILAIS